MSQFAIISSVEPLSTQSVQFYLNLPLDAETCKVAENHVPSQTLDLGKCA